MQKRHFPLIELYIATILIVLFVAGGAWLIGYRWGVRWWLALPISFGVLLAFIWVPAAIGGIVEFIFKKKNDDKTQK